MRINLDELAELLNVSSQQLSHAIQDGVLEGNINKPGELHNPDDWAEVSSIDAYLQLRMKNGAIRREEYTQLLRRLNRWEANYTQEL